MQLMNLCILQFRRIDDKWKRDELWALEVIRKKESNRTVKRHDELFYNKATIIVKNIKWEKQNVLVSQALMNDIPEDEEDEDIKVLMRMHPIQPTFAQTAKEKWAH